MYTYLLFDVDDTLFDTVYAHQCAHAAICKHFDFPNRAEDLVLFNKINDDLWNQFNAGKVTQAFLLVERYRLLFEKLGYSFDSTEANEVHLDTYGKSMRLLPHAEEVIRALSKNHKIYLITNAVAKVQRQRIKGSVIEPLIHGSFISEDVGYQKPTKEFFDYVFHHISGITKENSIVIGDSLTSDIIGSIEYGLPCCWYNPKHKLNKDSLSITYEIESLEELLAIVE